MDVSTWLQGLGLERHEAAFRDNSVDIFVVRELNENDLENSTLPLGDRKRVLRAIANLPRAKGGRLPIAAPRAQGRSGATAHHCHVHDLVGSTRLAATLDAEDWRDLVEPISMTCPAKAIGQYGGHVAGKLGDGLMELFGYPRARENDAERAVHAGLMLLRSLGAGTRRTPGAGFPRSPHASDSRQRPGGCGFHG